MVVDSALPVKQVSEIIQNTLPDYGVDVEKILLRKVGSPGRKIGVNTRLEAWLQKRTKPFDNATFARYMEMEYSAAYKKLQRMVKAGLLTREEDRAASRVYYQVVREE